MIRLIGILTGSALAVTAMLVAFGVPELAGSFDAPVAASPIEAAMPDAEAAVEVPPWPDPVQPAATNDEIDLAAFDLETDEGMPIEPEVPVEKLEQPVPLTAPEPAPTSQTDNWYAFWSPFRSEIAADGFVSELQRTTGLDYRVVKLKPGVYEVAFAYTDPTDRQDKLERISAATGLDMSGG
jgi:hypothetical protein